MPSGEFTDFLALCERAASFARRETELRERQREAEDLGRADEVRQLDRELEAVTIEKRIAIGYAVNGESLPPRRPSRSEH